MVETENMAGLRHIHMAPADPRVAELQAEVERLRKERDEARALASPLALETIGRVAVERDEARAAVDRLDAQATAARNVLTAAGVPEIVPYEEPKGGWPSEYEPSRHAGGRALQVPERIALLAEERDALREQLDQANEELEGLRGPACRVCGCTELEACEGGCGWAAPYLCTECVDTNKEGEVRDVA